MRNLLVDHLEYLPFAFSISIVFLAMAIEVVISRVIGRSIYSAKDTLSNFAMYAGYIAVDLIWIPVLFSAYTWIHHYSLFQLGTRWWSFQGNVPLWQWGLLFILDDFCFYLFHRTSHKICVLWTAASTRLDRI